MSATVQFCALADSAIRPPVLEADEIHLWSARLDLPPQRVSALETVLPAAERQRAERFREPRHRRRFIVGRSLTRALLGAYLQTPPGRIELRYGVQGKPAVDRPAGDLEFNLSHSGERIVIAVRRSHAVGVDIEQLRQVGEAAAIARKHFSAAELEQLEELPPADYMTGFFRCWTRKEALVKTVGDGVFAALDRFDVSLAPDQPARLVALDGEPVDDPEWTLFHLEPAAGVVGALATAGPQPSRLRAWTIDPGRQAVTGIDRHATV